MPLLKSINIEHIGEEGSAFSTHHEALESIDVDFSSLDAIGHRVVHGGEEFQESVLINGEVNAELVRVTAGVWYDNVLSPNYQLPSLNEVEVFIRANHHLPDIPSEQEVKKEGIDVGQMNALLLKKIEELTLYLIDLKKENESIKNEIYKLKNNK